MRKILELASLFLTAWLAAAPGQAQTGINLNHATPAAPSGARNVTFPERRERAHAERERLRHVSHRASRLPERVRPLHRRQLLPQQPALTHGRHLRCARLLR